MEWLTAVMLFLAVGSAINKAVKWLNWKIGADIGRKMLDRVYEEQKDRLEHQYEAQKQRLEETGAMVAGQQTAALAAMGQAGGQGTAGAGVLAHTQARKSEDQRLLDTAYRDAMEDLEAKYDLAVQEQSEKLAADVEASVQEMAKVGLGSLSLGMQGSRAQLLGDSQWIKPESGAYTWGLLG